MMSKRFLITYIVFVNSIFIVSYFIKDEFLRIIVGILIALVFSGFIIIAANEEVIKQDKESEEGVQ